MAEKQVVVFSIGRNSLINISGYLNPDYSSMANWSSPENLFREFLKKLSEEIGDPTGAVVKNEEFADGEIRFTVDCSETLATRVHEVLAAGQEEGFEGEREEGPEA